MSGRMRYSVLESVGICTCIAVGAGGAATAAARRTPHASAPTPITIAGPPALGIGDYYTAQALGAFRAEGLVVTLKPLTGGATVVPAMEAGSVQIGESNVVSILQGKQHGLGVKCFAGNFGSPNNGYAPLLIAPKFKAKIKAARQLAGETIAVNTLNNFSQVIVNSWLEKQHVNPKRVQFVAMPYPDMAAALKSGRVTAALPVPPFSTIAQREGAKVLAADPVRSVGNRPLISCWAAEGSWLAGHRAVANRFARAIAHADAYLAKHPKYLVRVAMKDLSIPAAVAKAMPPAFYTPKLNAHQLSPWRAGAVKFGFLAKATTVRSVIAPVPVAK